MLYFFADVLLGSCVVVEHCGALFSCLQPFPGRHLPCTHVEFGCNMTNVTIGVPIFVCALKSQHPPVTLFAGA
jgi:hypothetical protein